jgi:hypothetical protein
MLQKFTNDCSALQQSLQIIQNQLLSISDTYGDREILEDKLKKLIVSSWDCYSIFNHSEFIRFFS